MTTRSPEFNRNGSVTVVKLGEGYENLDETSVREVRESVMEAATNADPPLLLLNLSATEFFGSSFLEALFRAHSRMKERGGRFALCSLSAYCKEVVEVTHLDRLVEVFPDEATGAAALEGSVDG